LDLIGQTHVEAGKLYSQTIGDDLNIIVDFSLCVFISACESLSSGSGTTRPRQWEIRGIQAGAATVASVQTNSQSLDHGTCSHASRVIAKKKKKKKKRKKKNY